MPDTQPASLPDRPLDGALTVRCGELWVEQCRAADLAQRFGTPLHVISEGQLRGNARAIRDAFATAWAVGPVVILPSIKANYTLALRRILTEEGTGCDTFGPSELHAALAGRVPPQLISVNGSSKDAALIEAAVKAGARVTLDSAAELDLVTTAARRLSTRAKIRLRIRPDYDGLDMPSDLVPGRSVRDAAQGYKPGIAPEVVERLGAEALKRPELDLTGLMAHLGRHSARIDVWAGMAASFATLVGRLTKAWHWRPQEVDIGGGYPAPRDPTSPTRETAPPLEAIATAICGALRNGLSQGGLDPAGIRLELEPGRSLFANTGIHLARVCHVKTQTRPTPRRWIETDTTEMFMPDLLVERALFRPFFNGRAGNETPADIVGISCGFDVLAEQISAPQVEAGDLIAFLDTGAYQDAASANFNALPRPGTILVTGDRAEWIKRPETIAEVFARDVIPERFA
jgi:diaminopimelate decarboxylase